MSVDTHGKIKGFVRHEEILNFIRQKWDKDVKNTTLDEFQKVLSKYIEKHINSIKEYRWGTVSLVDKANEELQLW